VSGIVSLHGGSIEAHSAGPQRGSEFVVRLPVAAAQEEAASAAAPPDTPAAVITRRVLVVDDNADSAEALALLLRVEGHHVETAPDGPAALAAAERLRPEAMLIDIGMPGMDGCEVCGRIRTQPWGSGILMVAQTGWGQPQDRDRTRAAGFDAHLTKPVDPAVVHEMLTTLKTV
jgi:CheY-like chemotaxis protein